MISFVFGPARWLLAVSFLVFLAASSPGRPLADDGCAEHLPYGAPTAPGETARSDLYLCVAGARGDRAFFAVGYDRTRAVPRWAGYRLTRANVLRGAETVDATGARRPRFRRDPLLEALGGPRLTHGDFTGSGYDRGHLVPAAAMRGRKEAYAATFLVSNVALQNPALNRGAWRRLEARVRVWACALGAIHVTTGTVSLPTGKKSDRPRTHGLDGGERRVVVPGAFYKLLFSEAEGGRALAIVHANPPPGGPRGTPLLLSVDGLEVLTGLDFFPAMPRARQRRIEAAAPDLDFWETRAAAAGTCSNRRTPSAPRQGDRAAGS